VHALDKETCRPWLWMQTPWKADDPLFPTRRAPRSPEPVDGWSPGIPRPQNSTARPCAPSTRPPCFKTQLCNVATCKAGRLTLLRYGSSRASRDNQSDLSPRDLSIKRTEPLPAPHRATPSQDATDLPTACSPFLTASRATSLYISPTNRGIGGDNPVVPCLPDSKRKDQ